MAITIFFVAHWYTSLFSQTFYLHRYAAHRMFSMNKFWQRFFHLFAFISQGSSYLSPYVYGLMHRLHHAHADTEKDPHSPKFDGNIMKMMWKTKNYYMDIFTKKVTIDSKYTKDLPEWFAFDRLFHNMPTRIIMGGGYVIFYVFFATEWWMYLLLPIHFTMGPVHGVIINWFAHKYGYTNYQVKDTSKNLFPLDMVMMGEGLHNNHHKFGGRANFGTKWWEFDPTYPFIIAFDKLGIIQLDKKRSEIEP
jgi:stearoyl-CoA desaturase (delta-9 desaturase)